MFIRVLEAILLVMEMIVVTTPNIPGYKIIKVLGVVHGLTIRARGIGGQISASLQLIRGGRIKAYASELEKAREEALNRIIERAKAMGANAIVGADFETSDIFQGTAVAVSVYGTAVVVEPENKHGGGETENKQHNKNAIVFGYK